MAGVTLREQFPKLCNRARFLLDIPNCGDTIFCTHYLFERTLKRNKGCVPAASFYPIIEDVDITSWNGITSYTAEMGVVAKNHSTETIRNSTNLYVLLQRRQGVHPSLADGLVRRMYFTVDRNYPRSRVHDNFGHSCILA